MAASSRLERFPRAALLLALAGGCVLGTGEGQVTGVVSAPDCGIDPSEPFDLRADFFVGEEFAPVLNLRIQRTGDEIDYADVLFVSVTDAEDVAQNQLGVPLAVGATVSAPVRMALALNRRCPAHDRFTVPVSYQAVSGTITFASIYASDVSSNRSIEATFAGVHFVDPSNPAERYADLSGNFTFLYTRGRPAQRFP